MRDKEDILEAYCNLEQVIQISEYIFKLRDTLGTNRKPTVSTENYTSTLSIAELARRCKIADSNIAMAGLALK